MRTYNPKVTSVTPHGYTVGQSVAWSACKLISYRDRASRLPRNFCLHGPILGRKELRTSSNCAIDCIKQPFVDPPNSNTKVCLQASSSASRINLRDVAFSKKEHAMPIRMSSTTQRKGYIFSIRSCNIARRLPIARHFRFKSGIAAFP